MNAVRFLLIACMVMAMAQPVWAATDALLRASMMQEQGHPDKAEKLLREVLRQEPMNVFAMNQLGLSLLKQGRFEAAKAWLQRAAHLDAEDPFPRVWLGTLLLRENNPEKARELFENVLSNNPDHADALYFLGVIHGSAARVEQAAACFEKAGRNGGDDPALQCRLARAYVRLDMPEPARKAYERALQSAPGYGDALLGLGWLLYNQGQAESAFHYWEQALDDPQYAAKARESLAMAGNERALEACARGERSLAGELWRQVLRYDPENRAAAYYVKNSLAPGGACTEQGGYVP